MNKRIKELLKQSTNPPWDGEQGPMNEFNLERFAELIVRECADVVKYYYIRGGEPITPQHIKKHFGVEL
jgi:hypothetical protein